MIRNSKANWNKRNSMYRIEYCFDCEDYECSSYIEYVASINQILENNPLLLVEKSATLSEILGCSIVINGQYVPIESTQVREKLMVL